MNEKKTLLDIIDLFAQKHNMGKQEADTFVRNIFKVIEDALAAERYVKVKGLGTFKLTEVDARESVNVNTGERIEIKEHTKISYVPDTAMKELINKPFAYFETVILNENTTLEDTETEVENEGNPESVEETGGMPAEEENQVEVAEEQTDEESVPSPEEEKEIVAETDESEAVIHEENKEEVIPEPVLLEEQNTAEDAAEEKEVKEQEPPAVSSLQDSNQAQRPENTKKKWGATVALFLFVFLCWHYIHSNREEPVLLSPSSSVEALSCEELSVPVDSVMTIQEDTVKVLDSHTALVTLVDTIEYDMIGTKARHTLQEGESLVKIALKFYGTKSLWPYIVKYNKSIIRDANVIPVGTTLNIPELTLKQ